MPGGCDCFRYGVRIFLNSGCIPENPTAKLAGFKSLNLINSSVLKLSCSVLILCWNSEIGSVPFYVGFLFSFALLQQPLLNCRFWILCYVCPGAMGGLTHLASLSQSWGHAKWLAVTEAGITDQIMWQNSAIHSWLQISITLIWCCVFIQRGANLVYLISLWLSHCDANQLHSLEG